MPLTCLAHTLGLSLEASSFSVIATNLSKSMGLSTCSPPSFLESSPVLAKPNTLLSSLVPNMPLVFELSSPTLDTLSLLQCLCVMIRARSELQLIRSNKNDPKPLTWGSNGSATACTTANSQSPTYINTLINLADFFTKNLDPAKHDFFRKFLVTQHNWSRRNATFVLFKAQDFYWLTILLLLCLQIVSPFSFFEAFWCEKVCVCVFSCEVVVCYHALCRAQRNLNDAVATWIFRGHRTFSARTSEVVCVPSTWV